MQAFAFGTNDEPHSTFQVTGACFDLRPGLVQPNDPDIILFERFDRLREIRVRVVGESLAEDLADNGGAGVLDNLSVGPIHAKLR